MVSKSDRENEMFVKYVVKLGYNITGTTDITTCTECGKYRLCQEYEAPQPEAGQADVYLCEQCTWAISDADFREHYPDQWPEAERPAYIDLIDRNGEVIAPAVIPIETDTNYCEIAKRICQAWECLDCPHYQALMDRMDNPMAPIGLSWINKLPRLTNKKPKSKLQKLVDRLDLGWLKARIILRHGYKHYRLIKKHAELATYEEQRNMAMHEAELEIIIRQQWDEHVC